MRGWAADDRASLKKKNEKTKHENLRETISSQERKQNSTKITCIQTWVGRIYANHRGRNTIQQQRLWTANGSHAHAHTHTLTQHSIRVRFWHFIHRNHTSQQAGRQADRKLFEIYRFSSYAWLSIVRILLSTAPRTAANVKPTDALNGNPLVRCLIISEIYGSWAMAVWCGRSVPFYIKQFLLSIINSVIPSIFFFCVQSLGCCVYRHAHRIDWHPPIWRANERTDGRLGSVYTVCLLCCRRTECCCESKIADVVALATVRLARSIHLPHKMNTYSSI